MITVKAVFSNFRKLESGRSFIRWRTGWIRKQSEWRLMATEIKNTPVMHQHWNLLMIGRKGKYRQSRYIGLFSPELRMPLCYYIAQPVNRVPLLAKRQVITAMRIKVSETHLTTEGPNLKWKRIRVAELTCATVRHTTARKCDSTAGKAACSWTDRVCNIWVLVCPLAAAAVIICRAWKTWVSSERFPGDNVSVWI